MDNTDIRGLLGLALRAGKLAVGDEPVRDLLADGHARAIFFAQDAGAPLARKIGRIAEERGVPVLPLPCDKAALGAAFGRASCAVCALGDMGFAASAAAKLAPLSPAHAEAAALLRRRDERMQARKARPKKKGAKITEYIDVEEEDFERRFGDSKKPN